MENHSNNILDCLREQQRKGLCCDATIRVQEREFRMHKCLLVMSSDYFRDVFADKDDSVIILKDIFPETFETLMQYIYTGTLDITDSNIDRLLLASVQLQMKIVEDICKANVKNQFQSQHLGQFDDENDTSRAPSGSNIKERLDSKAEKSNNLPDQNGGDQKISSSRVNSAKPNAIHGEQEGNKEFTFKKEISGKHVMIGNDQASISEGTPLRFAKPLENEGSAKLKMGNSSGNQNNSSSGTNGLEKITALKNKALVGNGEVNVQQNEQNLFISGPGALDEKYRKPNPDEVDALVEGARRNMKNDRRADPDVAEQDSDKILRLARYLQEDRVIHPGNIEHFQHLCQLLANLSHSDRRALSPQFDQVESIYLECQEADFSNLGLFFSVFESKTFRYLSLRGLYLKSDNIRAMTKWMKPITVTTLDLRNCMYHSVVLLDLKSLFSHCEEVLLSGITGAAVYTQRGQRQFGSDDAKTLAESIRESGRITKVDFSWCDFTDDRLMRQLFSCLGNIRSLTLSHIILPGNASGLAVLVESLRQDMEFLDLSGTKIRDEGVEVLSTVIPRIRYVVLKGVMMRDEGLNSVAKQLELGEQLTEILDLSDNSFTNDGVSRILRCAAKFQALIFSKDQIKHEIHKSSFDERQMMLSEVVEGRICALENLDREGFSHWAVCAKSIDENSRAKVLQMFKSLGQEVMMPGRVEEYQCVSCKTGIAFFEDKLNNPCQYLFNDRKLMGAFKTPYYVSVSKASCKKDDKPSGKHSCKGCLLNGFEIYKVRCKDCSHRLGAFYRNATTNAYLWCLYQSVPTGKEVGEPDSMLVKAKSSIRAIPKAYSKYVNGKSDSDEAERKIDQF